MRLNHSQIVFLKTLMLCIALAFSFFLGANYSGNHVYVGHRPTKSNFTGFRSTLHEKSHTNSTPFALRHSGIITGTNNIPDVPKLFDGIVRPAVPKALVGQIGDVVELQGRHSDYIFPPCTKKKKTSSENKADFIGPFNYLKNYKNPCWLPEGESRIKCIPYFYIIGTPKAGSTDVFERIQLHPKVTTGNTKEVQWIDRRRFEKDYTFSKLLNVYSAANELIQSRSNASGYHDVIIGDGSTSYLFNSMRWQHVVGNEGCEEPRVTTISHIHRLWPKTKLILMMRDPVTRLFSAYLWFRDKPGFNASARQFDEWVKKSLDVWKSCLRRRSFRNCLYGIDVFEQTKIQSFTASFYSRLILDLLKLFPRDQVYFVRLESYSNNTKETMRDIYRFLELPPLSEAELDNVSKRTKANPGLKYGAVPQMWNSTRKILKDFYAPFNAELSAIFDGDPRWLW